MKRAFPVLVKKEGADFLVFVPDLKIFTEGRDMADAIGMARDAIGAKGVTMEDMGQDIPEASGAEEAVRCARESADEDLDFSDGIVTFVDVDFVGYRNKLMNRVVRKNCTIPFWLNEKAEKQGINFSKVLTDALIEKVGV